MIEVLNGHVSEETAYVVDDYPYGARLRCKIRYWIESNMKHGQRFCSQTTNPKLSYEKWNAPKKSTYMPVMVMYKDERGYVTHASLSMYDDESKIDAFVERFGKESVKDEFRQKMVKYLRAVARAQSRVTVTIVAGREPGQTLEEQQVMNSAVRGVLREMAVEERVYALAAEGKKGDGS